MASKKSEFGKGLCCCLGLFLAHEYKFQEIRKTIPDGWAEMWFNAAADHLFELETENVPKRLKKRIKVFQEKCLAWRCCYGDKKRASDKDVDWAVNEAKELLFLIDRSNGIDAVKSDYK